MTIVPNARGYEPGLIGYWPLNEAAGATTAANLKRGTTAATANCFWSGAEGSKGVE